MSQDYRHGPACLTLDYCYFLDLFYICSFTLNACVQCAYVIACIRRSEDHVQEIFLLWSWGPRDWTRFIRLRESTVSDWALSLAQFLWHGWVRHRLARRLEDEKSLCCWGTMKLSLIFAIPLWERESPCHISHSKAFLMNTPLCLLAHARP